MHNRKRNWDSIYYASAAPVAILLIYRVVSHPYLQPISFQRSGRPEGTQTTRNGVKTPLVSSLSERAIRGTMGNFTCLWTALESIRGNQVCGGFIGQNHFVNNIVCLDSTACIGCFPLFALSNIYFCVYF